MSVLIDTNVLLRRAQPGHPLHASAVDSVARFLARSTPVYFTPQNIAEFWNVATRPADKNGLGLPHATVLAEIAAIESLLILLPDAPAVCPEWKRLVTTHRVTGVKVNDARLVAFMSVFRIKSILTFNTGDFTRYPFIAALHPSEV
jgi:predicted nucleic acid-binding protein